MRFQPVSSEARYAVVQDAVRAQLTKERTVTYRRHAEAIADPVLADKLQRARFEADQLLLSVSEAKLIKTFQRTAAIHHATNVVSTTASSTQPHHHHHPQHEQQRQPHKASAVTPSSTTRSLVLANISNSPARTSNKWSFVSLEPSDLVDFERLAPGFRYSKSVVLKNNSSAPVSYVVERTTGTTTVKADAVTETKMIHSLLSTTTTTATHPAQHTRFVQVQHQRGNLNPSGGEAAITFIVDATGPRRIADVFMIHLDRDAGGPSLPVTVRADIIMVGGNAATTADAGSEAGFVLSSSVKVLGKTL